jgi:hypothetical protein
MPNNTIFYPLLKKGLQELGDTSSIESDIAQLQSDVSTLHSTKVTKFFSATDTIEDGEVAEYQGPDDAVNGLVNGYFYKKNNELPSVVQCCRLYKNVSGLNVTYNEGDYIYDRSEDYSSTINLVSITVQGDAEYRYLTIGNSTDIQIGTIIYKSDVTEIQNVYAKVVSITDDTYYLDDSTNFTVISKRSRGGSDLYYYKNNNQELVMLQDEYWQPVAAIGFDNGTPYPIIFMPWQTGSYHDPEMIGVYTTVTVTPPPFIRIDTQPRTPGVTVADGVLQISLPVEFSGNITVHGSEVIVTTEQIQSEKDFIKLRYNNPLALAAGETSGISVNNYDGNATDCILAVDKDGWARVGDSSGTLEKIATIEENPADSDFVQYDAQNKQLKTAPIPEATTTAAGLMSSTDKVKLDNIDAQFIVYHQFNPLNATTIEEAIKKTVDNFFNANITTNILCYGTMFWQGIYRFEGYMYPFSVGICRFDFIPILSNGVGYVGRYNAGWHFNS